jgi:hypothetical protein
MARLSDFLGGLASGICDARVNSDVQSLRIAEEYAKNDLLKHFSVPRMRIDKVELNIPVAVDSLMEKTQRIYQPIDNQRFSAKAYQQVLKSLSVTSLSSEVSKNLRTEIADQVHLLEAKIKVNQTEDSLEEFSNSIALKIAEIADTVNSVNKRRKATKAELTKLQTNTAMELKAVLREEIVLKKEVSVVDAVHVIVEADRLREIRPENVIMIKMTISEQGMEWINMEDKDGKVVNKLMPE